jgi:carboxymethylenebutenolidase
MGSTISLTAADGATIGGYLAEPTGTAKGGIIVLQEIFGVNSHIRSVTDRVAAEGYVALAPIFFDRLGGGIELDYNPDTIQQGIGHVSRLGAEMPLADIASAIAELQSRNVGKIGITGFCWGGTFTWAAACNLPGLSAAVGYYGGGIHGMRTMTPQVPTMLHFGDRDIYITAEHIEEIAAAHPEVDIHRYDANHGFHCDARADYDQPSAVSAWERTFAFFAQHLA